MSRDRSPHSWMTVLGKTGAGRGSILVCELVGVMSIIKKKGERVKYGLVLSNVWV